MARVQFCGGCGTPRVPGDRFCHTCGRDFEADPARPSPVATGLPPAATNSDAELSATPPFASPARASVDASPITQVLRLWGPWILVLAGLLVVSYFGGRAFAANQVIERIDATSPVPSVRGISWILETLGLPNLGAVIDPRNNALYEASRREYSRSLIIAILGSVLALIGLRGVLGTRSRSTELSTVPAFLRTSPSPVALLGPIALAAALFFPFSRQAIFDEPVASRTVSTVAATTVAPIATAVTLAPLAVIQGITAAVGQPIPPTPTAAVVFYRSAPYGPVKIEAGQVQPVRFTLDQGTRVAATVTVAFNNRLSNATGTPDIDIDVRGPSGTLATYPQSRNGFQLAFQAPTRGEYTVELSNARSRVNAKQVAMQFLQP